MSDDDHIKPPLPPAPPHDQPLKDGDANAAPPKPVPLTDIEPAETPDDPATKATAAANIAGKTTVTTAPDDDALPEDYDPMAAITQKKELEAQKAKEKAEKKALKTDGGLKGKLKKSPDDKFTQAVKQSRLQAKKKQKRKKHIKFGIAGAAVVVIIALFMYMMTPYKGGMNYGICKVFAERTLTFPDTLKIMATEEFGSSIRVWYMMIDSFGNERMQPIQCYYTTDEYGYLKLTKVKIRRRELEQSKIDSFNKTIPVIYAFPPNLEIPYPDTETLQNLHYEVNRYRKPIL